jgi:hypothetical protein
MMTQRYAHLRDETLRRASNLAGNLIEQTIKGTKIQEKKKRRVKRPQFDRRSRET